MLGIVQHSVGVGVGSVLGGKCCTIPTLSKDIEETLKIVVTKLTMGQISKDDANLITSEGSFEFLFEELEQIDTYLSQELLIQLKVELTPLE